FDTTRREFQEFASLPIPTRSKWLYSLHRTIQKYWFDNVHEPLTNGQNVFVPERTAIVDPEEQGFAFAERDETRYWSVQGSIAKNGKRWIPGKSNMPYTRDHTRILSFQPFPNLE